MAQAVDARGMDQLMSAWDRLLQRFPQEKQLLLRQVGGTILEQVRLRIGGTGKVAGWQEPHMGSKGGYVAVRPASDVFQMTQSGTRYPVGYITNAIEGGHRISEPRGGKGYRPRIHVPAVSGRWFYDAVRRQLPGIAEEAARQLANLICDGLEGML